MEKATAALRDMCMFTGHRQLPADTRPLERAMDRHITQLYGRGFRLFASGGAMGFDLLAAERVLGAKVSCPEIQLVLMLPCRGQDKYYSLADQARYRRLLETADRVVFLSERYYKGCMHARNRAMVEGAGLCLCYLTHSGGGTAFTVRLAVQKGLEIINAALDE